MKTYAGGKYVESSIVSSKRPQGVFRAQGGSLPKIETVQKVTEQLMWQCKAS